MVLFAEPQQQAAVVPGYLLLALGSQRVVVDLEQRVGLFRYQHQLFEVEVGSAVAGMADDVDLGMVHHPEHAARVLFSCAALPAFDVDAGDADVEAVEIVVGEVEMALGVEDVHLAAHQQAHAIHLTGNDKHVFEIEQGAGALDARTVFGDAQVLHVLFSGGLGHFLQAAVGMARGNGVGVGVDIYLSFHILLFNGVFSSCSVQRWVLYSFAGL